MRLTTQIRMSLDEGAGVPGVDVPVIQRVRINRGVRPTMTWYVECSSSKCSPQWVLNRVVAAQLREAGIEPNAREINRFKRDHALTQKSVVDVSDTFSQVVNASPKHNRFISLSAGKSESKARVTDDLIQRVESEINSIEKEVPELDLQANLTRYGYIFIHGIRVLKNSPAGTGTKGLERVISVADKYGLPVCLDIAPRDSVDKHSRFKHTTSRLRLEKWYRSYGFRPKSVLGRFDLGGSFVRLPKT